MYNHTTFRVTWSFGPRSDVVLNIWIHPFPLKSWYFCVFFPRNPRWVCVAWLMFSQRRHLHGWCPSWRSCRQGSNNRSRTSSNNKKCHQRQIVQRRTSCALCGCGWKTQRERERKRGGVFQAMHWRVVAWSVVCTQCFVHSYTLIIVLLFSDLQWQFIRSDFPYFLSVPIRSWWCGSCRRGVCVKGRPRGVQPRVYLLVIGREKWKDLFFWGLKL